jgi:predicted transcriptional regulator
MTTDIDTEPTQEQDNTVPEPTAAASFGNPSLDADRISDDTDAAIDSLLDEAVKETEGSIEPEQAPEAPEPVSTADVKAALEQPLAQQPTAPQAAEVTEIDPEIASIEQPRNLSEANRNNWKKLQETASIYKRQAQEAEALRQRLQQVESGQQQIPQDYEDLKKFRQIFDLKNDSEFQARYDKPINSAKDTIYGLLRKHGASDEVIASIEKAGGPDKIDQNWWKANAIDKLPMLDAEVLKDGLKEIHKLKTAQQTELEQAANNIEQFMVKRGEANLHWYENERSQIYKHIDNVTKEIPWARFYEPNPTATPEERAAIEKHNAKVADLADKFESALWPTTSQQRLEAQLKKLNDENSKIKGASRMPRSTVTGSNASKGSSLSDRIKMSASDAIDMGLDEAGA